MSGPLKPPSEKGIMDAMKSMKTIAGKKGAHKFPSPPTDFVDTIKAQAKQPTRNSLGKKITTKKAKKKGTSAPPRPPAPPSTQLPMAPPPMEKQDTNSQLFGTLINSLKTRPAGMDPAKPAAAAAAAATAAASKHPKTKKKNNKNKKGYESSLSSSSAASVSSSSSVSTSTSYPTSTASTCPSSVSRTSRRRSVSSSETVSTGSSAASHRIAKERKKRKEELLHEKIEMLTRIVNLSKNGFTATKEWDMNDDIDEIRYECYRMQRESNSKKSVKIMRRVLVTITTLIETGNAYFNPFNLRLEGFSESMMLNLSDYDDCFEQIHHKYSGRSSVGPEMQIIFTFMSAAIFHHAGNAIGQARRGGDKKKSSASPMSSVMSMMGMLNNSSTYPTPRTTPPPRPTADKQVPREGTSESGKPKRKVMRGPGASAIPTSLFAANNPGSQTTPSMSIVAD